MKLISKFSIIVILLYLVSPVKDVFANLLEVKYQNYLIQYHVNDENRALQVVRILEKNVPAIEKFYGIDFRGRITLILSGSTTEFQSLTRSQLPNWSAAVFLPAEMKIIIRDPTFLHTEDQLEKEITHEISHLYFSARFPGVELPLWFNEGLAEYLSLEEIDLHRGVVIANALFAKKIIPLTNIDSLLSFSPGRAQLAYTQSFSAVIFLGNLLKHSGSNWPVFLETIEKKGFQPALSQNIHMDAIDFEVKWYQWLKNKYQWFVIFNLENLIWFGLAIVLIGALYAVRYRNRKRMSQWEEEELQHPGLLLNDIQDETLISNHEDT
jgi:hypothetical protein